MKPGRLIIILLLLILAAGGFSNLIGPEHPYLQPAPTKTQNFIAGLLFLACAISIIFLKDHKK